MIKKYSELKKGRAGYSWVDIYKNGTYLGQLPVEEFMKQQEATPTSNVNDVVMRYNQLHKQKHDGFEAQLS